MKMKMQQEKQKNESTGRKVCLSLCGLLALSYSGLLCFFFYKHWEQAEQLRKSGDDEGYVCMWSVESSGTRQYQEDHAQLWISWMFNGFICYAILSVMALFAVVGAWLVALRPLGGCCFCCAQIYALVCVIALSVVRWGEKGSFCNDEAGSKTALGQVIVSKELAEDGQFLQRALIAMWCLGCLHCCMLSAGLSPQQ